MRVWSLEETVVKALSLAAVTYQGAVDLLWPPPFSAAFSNNYPIPGCPNPGSCRDFGCTSECSEAVESGGRMAECDGHPLAEPLVHYGTCRACEKPIDSPECICWDDDEDASAPCLRCEHPSDRHVRVGGIIDPCSQCDCDDLDLTGWFSESSSLAVALAAEKSPPQEAEDAACGEGPADAVNSIPPESGTAGHLTSIPDTVTRVVLVNEYGSGYTEKWAESWDLHVQDDGRTLKLFPRTPTEPRYEHTPGFFEVPRGAPWATNLFEQHKKAGR